MGADDWHDPHGLVPEAFKNTFPEHDSVRDALRHAERLPSSTPPEDRAGTCPECGSVSIGPVGTGQGDGSEYDWKCNECEYRFRDPDKPDMDRYDNTRHLRFNFLDDGDLVEPENRTELQPPFAEYDDETLRALAIGLYQPWHDAGPSYRELVPYFPYSRKWIGDRVRAWKDGEYRDLVPDPTAEPEPEPDNDPPIDPRAAVARIGGDYEELVAERAGNTDASSDTGALATDGGRVRRWDAFGS